jgi:hypothetical protein
MLDKLDKKRGGYFVCKSVLKQGIKMLKRGIKIMVKLHLNVNQGLDESEH